MDTEYHRQWLRQYVVRLAKHLIELEQNQSVLEEQYEDLLEHAIDAEQRSSLIISYNVSLKRHEAAIRHTNKLHEIAAKQLARLGNH